MNKPLKCIFCQDDLINGSFSQTGLFVYLTCWKCKKKIIIDRTDYDEYILGSKNDEKLNKWV